MAEEKPNPRFMAAHSTNALFRLPLTIPVLGQSISQIAAGNSETEDNRSLPSPPPGLVNTMLPYWIDAVRWYDALLQTSRGDHDYVYIDRIILYLGMSLARLFGRHWLADDAMTYLITPLQERKKRWKSVGFSGHPPATARHTPGLFQLVAYFYPLAKGWDLRADDKRLFDMVRSLNGDFNDLIKHYSDEKERGFFALTRDQLRTHMETARRVWLWFLQKRRDRGGQIPRENMRYFELEF